MGKRKSDRAGRAAMRSFVGSSAGGSQEASAAVLGGDRSWRPGAGPRVEHILAVASARICSRIISLVDLPFGSVFLINGLL